MPVSLALKRLSCAAMVGLFALNLSMAADEAPAASGPEAIPVDLEPIVVTARKAPVRRMIDRRTYDVAADLQSARALLRA